jgi:cytosine/adenosine deaminase-related metal-dependent hydrolase
MSSGKTPPLPLKLLTARYVWTAVGPLQRACGVLIEGGRITEIGDSQSLRHAHPDSQVINFDDAIILPGLINAHTHLELSNCTPGDAPTSFVDWILSMPRRVGREVNQPADEKFAAATRAGIEQSLRFGVTCVGDISQQMHVTRPILAGTPLRAVSYGEVIGLGKRRSRLEQLLPLAIDESNANDHLRIGISPHSPYTVEPYDLVKCANRARERQLPLAIHLAETPYEDEFLEFHTGPLRQMWDKLGSWADFEPLFKGGPIQLVRTLGLIRRPTLLAHVNYCSDHEISSLKRGQASVVYCPRTHKYFGHPPHRWREMLAADINVALGTDSCASSPDLNLVEELRLLHEIAPEVPAEKLWRMATANAAKAIQWDDEIGSIEKGKSSDFTIFPVQTNDPLREILECSGETPKPQVWIKGNPVSPC